MLDPISISAAFAIAKSTIAGVQEAIQMGKDLNECSGDLIEFFKHRDTVARAAVEEKKNPVLILKMLPVPYSRLGRCETLRRR